MRLADTKKGTLQFECDFDYSGFNIWHFGGFPSLKLLSHVASYQEDNSPPCEGGRLNAFLRVLISRILLIRLRKESNNQTEGALSGFHAFRDGRISGSGRS